MARVEGIRPVESIAAHGSLVRAEQDQHAALVGLQREISEQQENRDEHHHGIDEDQRNPSSRGVTHRGDHDGQRGAKEQHQVEAQHWPAAHRVGDDFGGMDTDSLAGHGCSLFG
jgi:hypothetical protein